MTIGKRIRDLRIKQGLSQTELGEKIGIQRSRMNKYEMETVGTIKKEIVEKLAQALNTTPSYLMGWEDYETTIKNELDTVVSVSKLFGEESVELLSIFAKLNKVGKNKIIEQALDLSKISDYLNP